MYDIKSVFVKKVKNATMAPRLPLKSTFNICAPNDDGQSHSDLATNSPISGYLSTSSKVY